MSKMYTLGLCTMDNSAAALFEDGVLIAAVEEERLTRKKNDGQFPVNAICEVLSIAKITISDVDEICIYWKPWNFFPRVISTIKKILFTPTNAFILLSKIVEVFFRSSNDSNTHGSWADLFKVKKIISTNIGNFKGRITYVDHHLSHQLYAESMRDWDEFISVSIDGGGEEFSTVINVVENGVRTNISRHKWPNSMGHFYSTFTGYLGFKMLEGEYKMMGLAPYGNPKYKELILNKILVLKPGGKYELKTSICDYHAALKERFNPNLEKLFGPKRKNDEKPTQNHIDLAASIQAAYEEAIFHILKPAVEKHPNIRRLVISGGCALNVTANGKLLLNGIFDEIIIPPAPHDAGCAIGACLSRVEQLDVSSVRSPYLGRKFSDLDIEKALKKNSITAYSKLNDEDLIIQTAKLLSQKKIVAWFQGRAEFGPRALGNRSYLADPRQDAIRDDINQKIKKRELFRPFAPSITIDDADKYFATKHDSPYMNIVSDVTTTAIPAVTHIDNTARVHTVSKATNPLYYNLIKEFGRRTGVPVLLNTSFNIQEPIVYSPNDAINTFTASEVDVLVLGSYLIERCKL